ncbi:Rieske 2Fe-2S domain-containing protein [Roseibium sp.]|uniref:Rieske 2Fe-2S domain-containing protein n=1 Tax=Roseibium sp. TaxID=1936156 RepID=UPI003A9790A9
MGSIWSRFTQHQATFSTEEVVSTLSLAEIGDGVSNFDDCFVFRSDDEIRIYDRVCDHNGGRLIFNNGQISCPMHGWTLDPQTGRYLNVACTKKPIKVCRASDCRQEIAFSIAESRRDLWGFDAQKRVEVEFLNHACLLFRTEGLQFATDPWLLGPAFSNGWWLNLPTPSDALDRLNACDFLFISHNHPDHLHRETLEYVRKDMPILTAAFETGSTVRFLRDIGFTDIVAADFDKRLVDQERQIALSVVKSGDFRDDSGLLLEIGAFSALLAVDANFIDFHRFPNGLTLYCSAFAAGASGFPLCFETYSEPEKDRLLVRNCNVVRHINLQSLGKMKPASFLPYAGFFTERATRDSYIKERNRKNDVASYREGCDALGVELLDVTQNDRFVFEGSNLVSSEYLGIAPLKQGDPKRYLEWTDEQFGTSSAEEIETYFLDSGYCRPLNLLIRLTDDAFEGGEEAYFCRFDESGPISVEALGRSGYEAALSRLDRYLAIRIRKAEFVRVIQQGLPWEDLSIGFQCRVQRKPNVYHSEFWYHFSNIYVNDKVRRESLKCDACLKLQEAFVV